MANCDVYWILSDISLYSIICMPFTRTFFYKSLDSIKFLNCLGIVERDGGEFLPLRIK